MIGNLLTHIDTFRSVRLCNQSSQHKALGQLPQGLYEYWRRTANLEFKGIPASRLFFAGAAEGLMEFFDCVSRAGQPCALPSLAADSVWHAWRRFSPDGLDQFCLQYFGRTIPHIDKATLASGHDAALATCLVTARRAQSLAPPGMSLPHLFKLDAQLRMPGGFGYAVAGEHIGFHRLDRIGVAWGPLHRVDALSPVALLNAGLVTQDEYQDFRRRNGDGGGDSGATSSNGRDCDNDGNGGGDGCGGGCGGGD